MPSSLSLSELAAALDCRLDGDGSIEITGISDLEHAQDGDLSFYGHPRYRMLVDRSRASALIVGKDVVLDNRALLRSPLPYYSFARALELFHPPTRPTPGVSELAEVSDSAHIGDDVYIGPFVTIDAGARIGARTQVHSHVSIGANATIGADCLLHTHVAVRDRVVVGDRVVVHNGAVLGSDGFGFTPDPEGRHYKIPQVGIVVIEDDVEIGANTTVDRASVGETRIGAGSKIDNLVQVAHGVQIGRHVLLAAQVGIAGSSVVEDRVMLGGQVGVNGHITLGKGVIAAGKSGITDSIEPGTFVTGYPAIENRAWRKASAVFSRLPELRQQIVALEKRLAALETSSGSTPPTGDGE